MILLILFCGYVIRFNEYAESAVAVPSADEEGRRSFVYGVRCGDAATGAGAVNLYVESFRDADGETGEEAVYLEADIGGDGRF